MPLSFRDVSLLFGLLAALGTAAAAEAEVAVQCRESWRARPYGSSLRGHDIDRITVHHSASGSPKAAANVARLIRSFQAMHMAAPKRYPDVAYHLLIDADGRVWEGRPLWARGDTPTDYNPEGHLLLCLIGNFERGQVSEAQWRSLVEVVTWASAEWQVPLDRVAGHSTYASTLCPGRELHRRLADGQLARAVEVRRSKGAVGLQSCPRRLPTGTP